MQTYIPSERLDAILEGTFPVPPHVKVLASVMRGGVRLCMVPQVVEPFHVEKNKPTIFVIGDDTNKAVGPDGFHLPSIRRAIRSCGAFSVISCEALPAAYACPAMTAVTLRINAMIVETRLAKEADWYNLIKKLAPNKPILLATIKGGRA